MQTPRGQFVKHAEEPTEAPKEVERSTVGELPPQVAHYVAVVAKVARRQAEAGPTVEVNESLGVLAFAYEKLRNSVEYREEHVLLRNAIRRILKRRLNYWWQYESIATALLRELIWARYLDNDSVPQGKVAEIEQILRRHNGLRQEIDRLWKAAGSQAPIRQWSAESWNDWIVGLAACEIERALVDRQTSYALAEVMYQWLLEHVRTVGLSDDDRPVQIYLAVHRTLLKSDRILLAYHLFGLQVPEWRKMSEPEAVALAGQLPRLRQLLEEQLHFPLGQELARAVNRYVPPFVVLADVVEGQPALAPGVLANPTQLRKKVDEACKEHYLGIRQRATRAIVRSVIYIFLTKMLLALLLEVPYDTYFFGAVHWIQLGFNVAFPPLFMAALGLSIRVPGEDNTERIFQRLSEIISGGGRPETILLGHKKDGLSPLLSLLYAATSLTIFGSVAWLLWRFDFSVLGIGLFLFFLCVVVFFAYRVRQIAQEMRVVREKENIVESLVTFLTLPFLRFGYRLSAEFGKINVLAFVLDVLLEAPFKLILDLAEHWLDFVRRKQEEVVDRHEY